MEEVASDESSQAEGNDESNDDEMTVLAQTGSKHASDDDAIDSSDSDDVTGNDDTAASDGDSSVGKDAGTGTEHDEGDIINEDDKEDDTTASKDDDTAGWDDDSGETAFVQTGSKHASDDDATGTSDTDDV